MERAKADDDLVINRDGAVVLIDPVSVNYMAGSEIDFVDDLIGASFKVKNPQAKASCGCGTSFTL
jgi:iron-sulfur cluster assembly accessory protein